MQGTRIKSSHRHHSLSGRYFAAIFSLLKSSSFRQWWLVTFYWLYSLLDLHTQQKLGDKVAKCWNRHFSLHFWTLLQVKNYHSQVVGWIGTSLLALLVFLKKSQRIVLYEGTSKMRLSPAIWNSTITSTISGFKHKSISVYCMGRPISSSYMINNFGKLPVHSPSSKFSFPSSQGIH